MADTTSEEEAKAPEEREQPEFDVVRVANEARRAAAIKRHEQKMATGESERITLHTPTTLPRVARAARTPSGGPVTPTEMAAPSSTMNIAARQQELERAPEEEPIVVTTGEPGWGEVSAKPGSAPLPKRGPLVKAPSELSATGVTKGTAADLPPEKSIIGGEVHRPGVFGEGTGVIRAETKPEIPRDLPSLEEDIPFFLARDMGGTREERAAQRESEQRAGRQEFLSLPKERQQELIDKGEEPESLYDLQNQLELDKATAQYQQDYVPYDLQKWLRTTSDETVELAQSVLKKGGEWARAIVGTVYNVPEDQPFSGDWATVATDILAAHDQLAYTMVGKEFGVPPDVVAASAWDLNQRLTPEERADRFRNPDAYRERLLEELHTKKQETVRKMEEAKSKEVRELDKAELEDKWRKFYAYKWETGPTEILYDPNSGGFSSGAFRRDRAQIHIKELLSKEGLIDDPRTATQADVNAIINAWPRERQDVLVARAYDLADIDTRRMRAEGRNFIWYDSDPVGHTLAAADLPAPLRIIAAATMPRSGVTVDWTAPSEVPQTFPASPIEFESPGMWHMMEGLFPDVWGGGSLSYGRAYGKYTEDEEEKEKYYDKLKEFKGEEWSEKWMGGDPGLWPLNMRSPDDPEEAEQYREQLISDIEAFPSVLSETAQRSFDFLKDSVGYDHNLLERVKQVEHVAGRTGQTRYFSSQMAGLGSDIGTNLGMEGEDLRAWSRAFWTAGFMTELSAVGDPISGPLAIAGAAARKVDKAGHALRFRRIDSLADDMASGKISIEEGRGKIWELDKPVMAHIDDIYSARAGAHPAVVPHVRAAEKRAVGARKDADKLNAETGFVSSPTVLPGANVSTPPARNIYAMNRADELAGTNINPKRIQELAEAEAQEVFDEAVRLIDESTVDGDVYSVFRPDETGEVTERLYKKEGGQWFEHRETLPGPAPWTRDEVDEIIRLTTEVEGDGFTPKEAAALVREQRGPRPGYRPPDLDNPVPAEDLLGGVLQEGRFGGYEERVLDKAKIKYAESLDASAEALDYQATLARIRSDDYAAGIGRIHGRWRAADRGLQDAKRTRHAAQQAVDDAVAIQDRHRQKLAELVKKQTELNKKIKAIEDQGQTPSRELTEKSKKGGWLDGGSEIAKYSLEESILYKQKKALRAGESVLPALANLGEAHAVVTKWESLKDKAQLGIQQASLRGTEELDLVPTEAHPSLLSTLERQSEEVTREQWRASRAIDQALRSQAVAYEKAARLVRRKRRELGAEGLPLDEKKIQRRITKEIRAYEQEAKAKLYPQIVKEFTRNIRVGKKALKEIPKETKEFVDILVDADNARPTDQVVYSYSGIPFDPGEPPRVTLSPKPGQTEEKIGVQSMSIERQLELFGMKFYKKPFSNVVVKEVLQNSWDTIKDAYKSGAAGPALLKPGEGSIIVISTEKGDGIVPDRSYTFIDNGRGMSPEIVKETFIRPGETFKGNLGTEDSSGGFGLAKLTFLFGSKRLSLETYHQGTKTTLSFTPAELMQGEAILKTAPAPPEAHGTKLTIEVPEFWLEDGVQRPIDFRNVPTHSRHDIWTGSIPIFQQNRILGDVSVYTGIGDEAAEWFGSAIPGKLPEEALKPESTASVWFRGDPNQEAVGWSPGPTLMPLEEARKHWDKIDPDARPLISGRYRKLRKVLDDAWGWDEPPKWMQVWGREIVDHGIENLKRGDTAKIRAIDDQAGEYVWEGGKPLNVFGLDPTGPKPEWYAKALVDTPSEREAAKLRDVPPNEIISEVNKLTQEREFGRVLPGQELPTEVDDWIILSKDAQPSMQQRRERANWMGNRPFIEDDDIDGLSDDQLWVAWLGRKRKQVGFDEAMEGGRLETTWLGSMVPSKPTILEDVERGLISRWYDLRPEIQESFVEAAEFAVKRMVDDAYLSSMGDIERLFGHPDPAIPYSFDDPLEFQRWLAEEIPGFRNPMDIVSSLKEYGLISEQTYQQNKRAWEAALKGVSSDGEAGWWALDLGGKGLERGLTSIPAQIGDGFPQRIRAIWEEANWDNHSAARQAAIAAYQREPSPHLAKRLRTTDASLRRFGMDLASKIDPYVGLLKTDADKFFGKNYEKLSDIGLKEVAGLGRGKEALEDTPHLTTVHFDWGRADIYMNPTRDPRGGHVTVLIGGLYQFASSLRGALKFGFDKIPHKIVIDVRSNVKADHKFYPFNKQREDWNANISGNIQDLNKFLQMYVEAKEAEEVAENFSNILHLGKPHDAWSKGTPSDPWAGFRKYEESDEAYENTKSLDIAKERVLMEERREARRAKRAEEQERREGARITPDRPAPEMTIGETGRLVGDWKKRKEKASSEGRIETDIDPRAMRRSLFGGATVEPDIPLFHNNTNFDPFDLGDIEKFIDDKNIIRAEFFELFPTEFSGKVENALDNLWVQERPGWWVRNEWLMGPEARQFYENTRWDDIHTIRELDRGGLTPEEALDGTKYVLQTLGAATTKFRKDVARLVREYRGLDDLGYASGISFDTMYAGVHVRVPSNAFFLNPLMKMGGAGKTPNRLGDMFAQTLIHEAVHLKYGGHGGGFKDDGSNFVLGQHLLTNQLFAAGYLRPFQDYLIDFVGQNWETLSVLRGRYFGSDPRNTGSTLSGERLPTRGEEAVLGRQRESPGQPVRERGGPQGDDPRVEGLGEAHRGDEPRETGEIAGLIEQNIKGTTRTYSGVPVGGVFNNAIRDVTTAVSQGSRIIDPKATIKALEKVWGSAAINKATELLDPVSFARETAEDVLPELRQQFGGTEKPTVGGRAADTLRDILEAAREGETRFALSPVKEEALGDLDQALRHAWKESHPESEAIRTLEAINDAYRDLFGVWAEQSRGLFTQAAKQYLGPLGEPIGGAFEKAHKVKVEAQRSWARNFDPLRMTGEYGERAREVHRASLNLESQMRAEFFDAALLIAREHRNDPVVLQQKIEEFYLEWINTVEGLPVRGGRNSYSNSGALSLWDQFRYHILTDPSTVASMKTAHGKLVLIQEIENLHRVVLDDLKKVESGEEEILNLLQGLPYSNNKKVQDAVELGLKRGELDIEDLYKAKFGMTSDSLVRFLADTMDAENPILKSFAHAWYPRAGVNFPASVAPKLYNHAYKLLTGPNGHNAEHVFKEMGDFTARMPKRGTPGVGAGETVNPYGRPWAIASVAVSQGAVLHQVNNLLIKNLGGVLTIDQVRNANKILSGEVGRPFAEAGGTITERIGIGREGIREGLSALTRVGVPFTQTQVKTSLSKNIERFIVAGSDTSGRTAIIPKTMRDSIIDSQNLLIKEHHRQAVRNRDDLILWGTKDEWMRLWSSSVVTGLVIPNNFRHSLYNLWGDFSQTWQVIDLPTSLEMTARTVSQLPELAERAAKASVAGETAAKYGAPIYDAAKVTFQTIPGIPWFSEKMVLANQKMKETLKSNVVLGSVENALYNPLMKRLWNGEDGWMRLPDGRLKSFSNIRREWREGGILDTWASEDLMNAFGESNHRKAYSEMLGKIDRIPGGKAFTATVGRLGHAVGDWSTDISWMANLVQQRQRANLYMELLRQGYTEKEALRLCLNALYDWKNGAAVGTLGKTAVFWRFWKLAQSMMMREMAAPMTRTDPGMLEKMFKRGPFLKIHQQQVFRESFPSFMDPELMYDSEEDEIRSMQSAWALRPEWQRGKIGLGIRPIPVRTADYEMSKSRSYQYSTSYSGPITVMDLAELNFSMVGAAAAWLMKAVDPEMARKYVAPDYEERAVQSAINMMWGTRGEPMERFLEELDVETGGYSSGQKVPATAGEIDLWKKAVEGKMGFSPIRIWEEDDRLWMSSRDAYFLRNVMPILGTSLPQFLNAAWSDNVHMRIAAYEASGGTWGQPAPISSDENHLWNGSMQFVLKFTGLSSGTPVSSGLGNNSNAYKAKSPFVRQMEYKQSQGQAREREGRDKDFRMPDPLVDRLPPGRTKEDVELEESD